MRMRTFIVIVSILLLQFTMASAQNPYIREGSIGKQKEQAELPAKVPSSFRPIEKWVGEKFIFLPKPKPLQKYGYQMFQMFRVGKGRFDHPTYEECVGRIVTQKRLQYKWMIMVKFILVGEATA